MRGDPTAAKKRLSKAMISLSLAAAWLYPVTEI
jgi:hypothetical protein